jgi:hypothetical protein
LKIAAKQMVCMQKVCLIDFWDVGGSKKPATPSWLRFIKLVAVLLAVCPALVLTCLVPKLLVPPTSQKSIKQTFCIQTICFAAIFKQLAAVSLSTVF